MLFNRDRKRLAAIRLRPVPSATEEKPQRFVYFPYQYEKGGQGYYVTAEQANFLQYREWAPFSFFIVPFVFITFVIGFIGSFKLHALLFGVGLGIVAGYFFTKARIRAYNKFTNSLEKAPYRLTRQQYWMEYAQFHKKWGLYLNAFFWIAMLLLTSISMLFSLVEGMGSGMLWLLHIAAIFISVSSFRKTCILIKHRALAQKNDIKAGTLESLEKIEVTS